MALRSNWDNIGLKTAGGDSWYNSLQFGVQKRLSHGLQFQSSYTWSKTLDTGQGQVPSEAAGNPPTYSDPNHPGNAKGRADFDTPHFWTLNVLYDLPSSNRSGFGGILNGWRVGTIFKASAGH